MRQTSQKSKCRVFLILLLQPRKRFQNIDSVIHFHGIHSFEQLAGSTQYVLHLLFIIHMLGEKRLKTAQFELKTYYLEKKQSDKCLVHTADTILKG